MNSDAESIQPLVLVIEDDSEMRRCFRTLFEHFGYEVAVKHNAVEGLRILESGNGLPDLIVSDVFMEGMDGLELLKTLRGAEQWREIPVILVSGMHDGLGKFHHLAETLQIGQTIFLAKPFEIEDLLTAARNVTQRERLTAAAHILPQT